MTLFEKLKAGGQWLAVGAFVVAIVTLLVLALRGGGW